MCRHPESRCLPSDRMSEVDARPDIEVVRGDVRNREAVDQAVHGVDAVFHAAGLAGMWGAWKSFHATNVIGTQHVLAACRRHGVRRLVYTSSPSVVFTETDQCGDDESIPYA